MFLAQYHGSARKSASWAAAGHAMVGLNNSAWRQVVQVRVVHEGFLVQIEVRTEKVVGKLKVVAVD